VLVNVALHDAQQNLFTLLRKGTGIDDVSMQKALKVLRVRIKHAPESFKADGYWAAQYIQIIHAATLLQQMHVLKRQTFCQQYYGNTAPYKDGLPRLNTIINDAFRNHVFVFKRRPVPSGKLQADITLFPDKVALQSAVGITALDRWALRFDRSRPKRVVRGLVALARHPIKSFKV
jgi:hypothetical protein